jgi:hypothetical protein
MRPQPNGLRAFRVSGGHRVTDRSRPPLRPRIPDGFTDRARQAASDLVEAAEELYRARFDPRDPSIAHHARMDAHSAMLTIAQRIRELR